MSLSFSDVIRALLYLEQEKDLARIRIFQWSASCASSISLALTRHVNLNIIAAGVPALLCSAQVCVRWALRHVLSPSRPQPVVILRKSFRLVLHKVNKRVFYLNATIIPHSYILRHDRLLNTWRGQIYTLHRLFGHLANRSCGWRARSVENDRMALSVIHLIPTSA